MILKILGPGPLLLHGFWRSYGYRSLMPGAGMTTKATPLFLTSVDRRPSAEHTLRNKEIAISYAAYRAMLKYYFSDSLLLRKKMIEFGLDPDDTSEDPTTAGRDWQLGGEDGDRKTSPRWRQSNGRHA